MEGVHTEKDAEGKKKSDEQGAHEGGKRSMMMMMRGPKCAAAAAAAFIDNRKLSYFSRMPKHHAISCTSGGKDNDGLAPLRPGLGYYNSQCHHLLGVTLKTGGHRLERVCIHEGIS